MSIYFGQMIFDLTGVESNHNLFAARKDLYKLTNLATHAYSIIGPSVIARLAFKNVAYVSYNAEITGVVLAWFR